MTDIQVPSNLALKSKSPNTGFIAAQIDEASSGWPAELFYGFIIVWVGTATVFASLSELASMYVW